MPLFDWVDALSVLSWGPGSPAAIIRHELDRFDAEVEGQALDVPLSRDEVALARLLAYRAERDETEEAKLERSRWLEANRAERTFPCGVVPDPALEVPDPGRIRPTPQLEERPARLLPSDPGWAAPDPPVVASAPPPAPPEPEPSPAPRPMQVLAAVLPEEVVFIREQGQDEDVEEVGRLPRTAIREVDVLDAAGAHVAEPLRETIEPSRPMFTVLRWSNDGAPDEDRFLFRSAWSAWEAAHRLRATQRSP